MPDLKLGNQEGTREWNEVKPGFWSCHLGSRQRPKDFFARKSQPHLSAKKAHLGLHRVRWFYKLVPQNPNEPYFIDVEIEVLRVPMTLKLGPLGTVFTLGHATGLHNGCISSKENPRALPRPRVDSPGLGRNGRPSQKLGFQKGSPFALRQLWSPWSFHKHRTNEEEDDYVFNLICTDEKWGVDSLQLTHSLSAPPLQTTVIFPFKDQASDVVYFVCFLSLLIT